MFFQSYEPDAGEQMMRTQSQGDLVKPWRRLNVPGLQPHLQADEGCTINTPDISCEGNCAAALIQGTIFCAQKSTVPDMWYRGQSQQEAPLAPWDWWAPICR